MKARYNKMMGQLGMDPETKKDMLARLTRDQTDTADKTAANRKRTLPGRVLLAACLALALAVGAAAVSLTVGWESFLGRTPKEAVTPVGVSAITGDYTLTLQESIVDDTGAAFLLALTRNDGEVIQGDPQLNGNIYHWDVKVDGAFPNMGMWDHQSILSDDGKTAYYCMEFEAQGKEWDTERVTGKTITFQCDGVADMDWTEEELAMTQETVSLAPLALSAQQVDMSYEDLTTFGEENDELSALVAEQARKATIPLVRMASPRVNISAVLFTKDGLAVAVGDEEGLYRQGQYLISGGRALCLVDTRTGETWNCDGYVHRGKEDPFYLSLFRDCPLTTADLPYVEVTVCYRAEKVLSDQPVELSFVANVSQQTEVELDRDVDFRYHGGDCSVHAVGVKISPLRLLLNIDRIDRWLQKSGGTDYTTWEMVNRDGSRTLLKVGGLYPCDETQEIGRIKLVAVNEAGDRRLIDPDQAAALSIDGVEIPLT